MFLVAVDPPSGELEEKLERISNNPWVDAPVSLLSHHGDSCCEMAREWIRCMDFAQLNGAGALSGPRWLREKYKWGPSPWPLHWCEAVHEEVIDCGAHAALAQEAFEARGVSCCRAQFVQQYDRRAIEQWRTIWDREGAPSSWLGDRFIYHEGNAVLVGEQEVKLWDGSAACWISPSQSKGYGSLKAVRIFKPSGIAGPDSVQWGDRHIKLDSWHYVQ